MQQQQQTMKQKMSGIRPSRGLNKDVPPITLRSKNTMNMKSKAFKAKRRVSSAPTNMSPKAVSKPTKGMKKGSAGANITKKTYKSPRVTQANAQQQSMNSSPALSKTVSQQPAMAHVRGVKKAPGLPRSYSSVKNSVRKTMGY